MNGKFITSSSSTYKIVIVMCGREGGEKCARQQRPYGTIGIVGLGSMVSWEGGSGRG